MDRRRPLDSPRLLEPLGQARRRQPEAKTEGRPPARLPSLSTPRQSSDDALPPVKRGVAALSPLNAVTPDARPVGMRRHFFDEPGPPLVTPQPSEPKSFDTADARPPRFAADARRAPRPAAARPARAEHAAAARRRARPEARQDPARCRNARRPRARASASPADLSRRSFEPAAPEIFERGRTRSPADLSEILERGRSALAGRLSAGARGPESPRFSAGAESESRGFCRRKWKISSRGSAQPESPRLARQPDAAGSGAAGPRTWAAAAGGGRRPSWDHRPWWPSSQTV